MIDKLTEMAQSSNEKKHLLYMAGLFAGVAIVLALYLVKASIALIIAALLLTSLQFLSINSALYIILIGNLTFMKEFSYVHIEVAGVPLYITEYFLVVFIISLATSVLRQKSLERLWLLMLFAPYLLMGAVLAIVGLPDYGALSIRYSAIVYYSLLAVFVCYSGDKFKHGHLLYLLYFCSGINLFFHDLQHVFHSYPLKEMGAMVIASSVIFTTINYHLRGRTAGKKKHIFDALMVLPVFSFLSFPKSSLLASYIVIAVVLLVLNFKRISIRFRHVGVVTIFIGVFLITVVAHSALNSWSGTIGRTLGEIFAMTDPVVIGEEELVGEDSYELTQKKNAHWRFLVWNHLLDRVFKEGPVFGIGFGPEFNVPALEKYNYEGEQRMDPHNSYLQILLRMGFVGLIFFAIPVMFIVFAAIRHLFKASSGNEKELTLFLAIFAGLAVQAIFNVVLENAYGSTPFWIILGMIAVMAIPGKSEPESHADEEMAVN